MSRNVAQKKKNTGRVFGSRLTATISITLVLLLFAIMLTMGLFAHDLSARARESIRITVVLKDDIKPLELQKLKNTLGNASWSKSINYIDKEAALLELTDELGYSPSELLGYNPLPATIEVNMVPEAANITKIKAIEKELTAYRFVSEVTYQENLIELVNKNLLSIAKVLLCVALVLTFISFMLIRNTVRLMIYAKRFLIHTMCLVGARFSFIRRPFVWQNARCGIVSAFLATGIFYFALIGLDKVFPGISDAIDNRMMLIVFAVLAVLGISITCLSTVMAVNRYLRMTNDEMYYV